MPSDKEKDELLTTPLEDAQRTTPYKTPPASGETPPDLPDGSLRALRQRYDILAEVGRGGMGIVYRARDRETGDVVALKVLRPEIAAQPEVIERFKSELLLARKITHKNVCRTYELLRFGDTVAIAMEYVEGESLRHILSRYSPLSVRKGVEWASQICAGLAEAHAQGVVHRDLKPANIVIDRDGHAKVMDFGIARSVEAEMTQTGVTVGTPAYMSPEQAAGKPVDARSDIYSLGLILYEMFTGQPALQAESPAVFVVKQMHETPPPPRDVEPLLPSFLDRAIQTCLEKDPKKRFQSVAELGAALSEREEGKPLISEGGEVQLPVHLTRWQRSDWLLVLAAVAGLVLFFPCFNRTSLAPRSKVSFDRSVLEKVAQDYGQRLGAPLGNKRRVDTWWFIDGYDYVAKSAGARAALELTNNPVPYWLWYVEWERPNIEPARIYLDSRGSLAVFRRDFPLGGPTERLSLEEAKPLAEKALREFFDRDASLLRLETATGDTWLGHAANSFTWSGTNDYHGLKRRYIVRLVGREIGVLDSRYEVPPGYVGRDLNDIGWQLLPLLGLDLIVVTLGFSQRHLVDLGARWRTSFVGLGLVLGGCWFWLMTPHLAGAMRFILSLFISLSTAVLLFFFSIALERSVRRISPPKFTNFVRLFGLRVATVSCGLAILRGTFVGVALVGAETFLVWVGTRYLGMQLDSLIHVGIQVREFLRAPWPSVHIVNALFQALSIAIVIAFLASIVERFVKRCGLMIFLAAVLASVFLAVPIFNLGAAQPYHFKVLLLLFDCWVLVWTFTRFDVLTLLAAAFTFAFCWENYLLLIMFEPTGALEQWFAFAAFGFFVLAAAAVAFRPELARAIQRAKAEMQ